MFKFENPLDPSKDGQNPLIDGIRYHIRNSESIKEAVISLIPEYIAYARGKEIDNAVDILDMILNHLGYNADELTIADEHELIDKIYGEMGWLG